MHSPTGHRLLQATVLAAFLTILPASPQELATPARITSTLNDAITSSSIREFCSCELMAAIWGNVDASVIVGSAHTTDHADRVFRITSGLFYNEISATHPSGGSAASQRTGLISIPSAEVAFQRGAPFFVSAPKLENNNTRISYTLLSNPNVPVTGDCPRYQTLSGGMNTETIGTNQRVSSSPNPQNLTYDIRSVSPDSQRRFAIVKYGDSFRCLHSNEIDLVALAGGPSFSAWGVTSAASFAHGAVSPGEIVSIFGSNIGPSAGVSNAGYDPGTGALATTLANVIVSFDGQAAPLFFVRGDQINVQVPYEVAGKTSTNVVVSYNGTSTMAVSVPVTAARPGIFGYNGRALVLNANTGAVIDASNAIERGGWITIYGTGPGLTDPTPGTGRPALSLPLHMARNPQAKIGGRTVPIDFAGMTPGYAGLLQINLQVPFDAPTGSDVPLELSLNGVTAQAYVGSAPTGALTVAIR